jgi:hypothetical protein
MLVGLVGSAVGSGVGSKVGSGVGSGVGISVKDSEIENEEALDPIFCNASDKWWILSIELCTTDKPSSFLPLPLYEFEWYSNFPISLALEPMHKSMKYNNTIVLIVIILLLFHIIKINSFKNVKIRIISHRITIGI